ncbi:hypothetical protein EC9_39880 [Rosistilla ulvae]|uniref:DUF3127 domain-containing protein n=1 Tax=Rosistilla ulvae TaxID=1930277 RepID=A0A517M4J7_9BACT|nr:DUF3127 domain-containing protein [Rosistilla ulvae]QDS89788.1 hypothetical protein EC9_39880 [Rosistilla ulvae]
MSEAKVKGIVHLVEETKTYGAKGFRKRMVVLSQDFGSFTNYVPLEFTRDNCDLANDLNVGDEIEVNYRLNGRKWQKDANSEVKYFLSAEAMGFKAVGNPPAAGGRDAASANDAFSEVSYDEGDVPF